MKNVLSAVVVAVIVVIGVFYVFSIKENTVTPLGGVGVDEAYQSTSTPAVADVTNLCPARVGMASSTTGVLGSVNITKSGAGELIIYDATTSDNTKRKSVATSSLILVDFGVSPTAGSYQLDVEFKRGLLIDYTTTGTGVSSSTISYRCQG